MKLSPGTRLRSQVDTTEIIVVRPGSGDVAVACGGRPMIDMKAELAAEATPVGDPGSGTQLGKRYTAGGEPGFEVLVTKPGNWSITADGEPLVLKEAKSLPASD